MKIWKDGDESRAICPTCERRTGIVFRRRSVELEGPDVRVPDVLVGVCRDCQGVAMIPEQSTPRLRSAIERPKRTMNARLPGHLIDVLSLLADRWTGGARSSAPALVRFLVHRFAADAALARRVKSHLGDPLAGGAGDDDLSVRVPLHLLIAMDEMAERVGIATRTDVLRGLLVMAKEDLLEERDPDLVRAVRQAIVAVA
ncbi:MAG TPA: hypothetical protein VGB42_08410 [Candidatus Thermoplasmatota archaeon]